MKPLDTNLLSNSNIKKQIVITTNYVNVIIEETRQQGKLDSPIRQFRIIINLLHVVLSFFYIMPTYSEEDLTTTITAYYNSEYTSIRKCTYMFNILYLTFSNQLTKATICSRSYESQKILLTTKEETLLKSITRLSKLGCPITLSLIRDLTKEI